MNFSEVAFFYFILVVYGLWLACRRHDRLNAAVLWLASLAFYGFHQWELTLLILAYCGVGWWVGVRIGRSRRPRLVLAAGIAANLLGLCYWKYTPLLVRTCASLLTAMDFPTAVQVPGQWSIPLGISFYAFTIIAYMVDVYRGETQAEPSLWRFALFVSFFPQLVAGPILRAGDFLPQLQPGAMPRQPVAVLEAVQLIGRGFFKKMVLADRIAWAIDPFFAHVADASTAGVWSLPYVYLYAFQIYFDFSGYTDIARGLGLWFGFRWPENFQNPYLAVSVQDFWRRWHMTLSRFLRDYLYVPLGGSRCGALRTHVNLMLTMLLGGLWHGASWSFLLWGGMHGLLLVVNRLWSGCRAHDRLQALGGVAGWLWAGVRILLTFHAVCLAWCFFRLTAMNESLMCVQKWVWFDSATMFAGGSADRSLWLLLVLYGLVASAGGLMARIPARWWAEVSPAATQFGRGLAWGLSVSLIALALLLSPAGEAPPFIYFQF
jgi:D-alanyl-lipoteichoic acid acyltransferase DltB (MBOAT superfamily)